MLFQNNCCLLLAAHRREITPRYNRNVGDDFMINIAICDDKIEFSNKLEKILLDILKEEKIQADIDVYQSGNELLNKLQEDKIRYDIIFLDIEMKGMNGLETAKEIRKQDEITMLIYVTSHKSYAIEAYEVQPFRFVVKPVQRDVLYECFKKAYKKIIAGDIYFRYKYEKIYYRVLVRDILYFESDKRVIWIHLKNGSTRRFYDKLNNIEKQMKKGKVDFYRLHKSILVNSRYITKKAYNYVELINGRKLDISENRRKEIGKLYVQGIEDDMDE